MNAQQTFNTFGSIRNTLRSKPKATQGELIEAVTSLVNLASEHGTLTVAHAGPAKQTYWANLCVYLKECGFEVLGAGFFSVVLTHPALSKRVLKVGLKKEDSAAAYTAWCRINQGRAGVPNIYETRRSTGCYVVVLDELLPIDLDKLGEFKGWMTAKAGVHGHEFEYHGEQHLRELYETGKLIRDFFKGLAEFDMHDGNVMVHPDTGEVIITDPVSYSRRTSKETSWALVDNQTAMNDLQRERMAQRARERHLRNQHRKELRKARNQRMVAPVPVIATTKGFTKFEHLCVKGPTHFVSTLEASAPRLNPSLLARINGLDDELQKQLMG